MIPENGHERNDGRKLMCTNCGNEDVILTLRLRHPHGWQAWAQCLRCGAQNWVQDQNEPWALIRYMPTEEQAQPVEVERWATPVSL